MNKPVTLTPGDIASTRIAELVEQIERAERSRDRFRAEMDRHDWFTDARQHATWAADARADEAEAARAELRAIIGCDPYRLANAIGA